MKRNTSIICRNDFHILPFYSVRYFRVLFLRITSNTLGSNTRDVITFALINSPSFSASFYEHDVFVSNYKGGNLHSFHNIARMCAKLVGKRLQR